MTFEEFVKEKVRDYKYMKDYGIILDYEMISDSEKETLEIRWKPIPALQSIKIDFKNYGNSSDCMPN